MGGYQSSIGVFEGTRSHRSAAAAISSGCSLDPAESGFHGSFKTAESKCSAPRAAVLTERRYRRSRTMTSKTVIATDRAANADLYCGINREEIPPSSGTKTTISNWAICQRTAMTYKPCLAFRRCRFSDEFWSTSMVDSLDCAAEDAINVIPSSPHANCCIIPD